MEWIGINGHFGNVEEVLYIIGDTMLEGDWYYKLRKYSHFEQVSPTYYSSESDGYAYALKESPDSVFTYRYPDGSISMVPQSKSGWPGYSILQFGGEIPHKVYWGTINPILSGWIEGIGEAQIGGIFPYEPGSRVFKCYTRDTLSTTFYDTTCTIDFNLVGTSEIANWENILIFPNPASSYIRFIGFENKLIDVKIYDQTGQLAFAIQGLFGSDSINVMYLNSGLYYVLVEDQQDTYHGKLVISH